MTYPENCPFCRADLLGEPIPEHLREHYGPPHRWLRVISEYSPRTDATSNWRCPDCGHRWPVTRREELG